MSVPSDFPMKIAQINFALFRSLYHSAAILALSRRFGDAWTSTIESKSIILEIGNKPMVDYLARPNESRDELMGMERRMIEAASLWEAALEAGVSEEELTHSLREFEANEANAPNDEIWISMGDLIEKQASEEFDA